MTSQLQNWNIFFRKWSKGVGLPLCEIFCEIEEGKWVSVRLAFPPWKGAFHYFLRFHCLALVLQKTALYIVETIDRSKKSRIRCVCKCYRIWAFWKGLTIELHKALVLESLGAVVETVELFFSIGLRRTLGGFQFGCFGFGLTAPSTRDGISTGVCWFATLGTLLCVYWVARLLKSRYIVSGDEIIFNFAPWLIVTVSVRNWTCLRTLFFWVLQCSNLNGRKAQFRWGNLILLGCFCGVSKALQCSVQLSNSYSNERLWLSNFGSLVSVCF